MGTVVRGDGVDVGVSVGVVEAEGDLLVDVHVGGGQVRLHPRGAGVANEGGDLVKGQTQLTAVGGEVIQGEGGVVVVQTRVQDRHHGAGAVVRKARAVEDTRGVDVDGVLHQLSSLGLGLLGLVDLTDDGGASVAHGLDKGLKIPRLDEDLKAAHDVGVALTRRVLELSLVEVGEQSAPLGGDALADGGGLVREGVFSEAHTRGGPGVLLQKGLLLDLNDDRDLVGLLDGLGKLVDHRAVVVVLLVGDEILVKEMDPAPIDSAVRDQPANDGGGRGQDHHGGQHHRQDADRSLLLCGICEHVPYLSDAFRRIFDTNKKVHA